MRPEFINHASIIKAKSAGYVALFSAIIMAAVLLVIGAALSRSAFYLRFNVLDAESKQISLNLAEACSQTAMLKLRQDANYQPPAKGECVGVGDVCGAPGARKICKICSVSTGGSYTIVTRAVFNRAFTNLQTIGQLNNSGFNVSSRQELASYFGPCGL